MGDTEDKARNPEGMSIGMSAMFDDISNLSTIACEQDTVSNEDLQALCTLAPLDMKLKEKCRFLEIMTASIYQGVIFLLY